MTGGRTSQIGCLDSRPPSAPICSFAARSESKILVSCDQGASRSPALAYVFIADQYGMGRETEAFNLRLGDTFLKRGGALLSPLKAFYARINAELFPKRV